MLHFFGPIVKVHTSHWWYQIIDLYNQLDNVWLILSVYIHFDEGSDKNNNVCDEYNDVFDMFLFACNGNI